MTPEPLLSVRRDIEKPPGGWKYTVPETGVVILGDFFSEMWPKIVRHHEANSLPAPDRELVEDRACRESPGGRCGPRKPKPVALPIQHLMLSHVERFLVTCWQAILDRKFVPRTEALRRVDVCLGCPLRTTMPSGCTSCFTLVKKAQQLLGKESAIVIEPDDDGFVRDTCNACGCLIPLKAYLGNPTLDKAEGSEKPAYWEKCWRLEK